MDSEEIEKEIADLESKIEQNKAEIADIIGVTAEEVDLGNIPTEQLTEEQVARIEELVQEITRYSMRIEALKERLSNMNADAARAFNEEV